MKLTFLIIAFMGFAYADVSELSGGYDYHPPQSQPHQTYLPPEVHHEEPIHAPAASYLPPQHHEQHEEHHEAPIPVQEYVPPPSPEHHVAVSQPIENYLPPAQHHEHHELHEHHEQPVHHIESYEPAHEDGYRYKTVRRVVYRYRQ